MDVKKYFCQAHRIDQRINSKLEQIISLRTLATKVNSAISDIPISFTNNQGVISKVVPRIVDLELEINEEIKTLIDVKKKIYQLIKIIKNPELKIILELRYLNLKKWSNIAVDMGYSVQNIYKLHNKAIKILQKSNL